MNDQLDQELAALETVYRALLPRTPEERERIVEYVVGRLEQETPKQSSVKTRGHDHD